MNTTLSKKRKPGPAKSEDNMSNQRSTAKPAIEKLVRFFEQNIC